MLPHPLPNPNHFCSFLLLLLLLQSSSNISCNIGLVVMNSFYFCLSGMFLLTSVSCTELWPFGVRSGCRQHRMSWIRIFMCWKNVTISWPGRKHVGRLWEEQLLLALVPTAFQSFPVRQRPAVPHQQKPIPHSLFLHLNHTFHHTDFIHWLLVGGPLAALLWTLWYWGPSPQSGHPLNPSKGPDTSCHSLPQELK